MSSPPTPARAQHPPSMTADTAAGSVRDIPARPSKHVTSGAFPETDDPRSRGARLLQAVLITALVFGPLVGVGVAGWLLWGTGIGLLEVILGAVLYAATGFGVTIGFHRGLTHRSFRARRGLLVVLIVSGSMAFQGGVCDWVAGHRRHHEFTDRPGDPHSPYRYGTSSKALVRGLYHAHMGWLYGHMESPAERYAPDLLRDPIIVRVHKLFPVFCVVSYALPFLIGFGVTRSWVGGITALVWAGAVRIALLQHVTWSVNSICHVFGSRPHATRDASDRSTNVWPLALISFGESWHNGHHAYPTCAQHGRRAREIDLSALVIRGFEGLGWVSRVRWSRPTDDTVHRSGMPVLVGDAPGGGTAPG